MAARCHGQRREYAEQARLDIQLPGLPRLVRSGASSQAPGKQAPDGEDRESRELTVPRRQILEVEKKKTDQKDPQDVISWLIRAEDEGDGSAPPGERAFQEDARVLVVAGSDTTSAALTNA